MACVLTARQCADELMRLQGEEYDKHGADSAPIDPVEYDKWAMSIADSLVAIYGMGDPFPMEAIRIADEENAHMAAHAAMVAFGYDGDEEDEG